MKTPEDYLRNAIALAVENVESGRGGPFGALVVLDGEVVATGVNLVAASNDPTAHAEIVAIRAACAQRASFLLEDCDVYSSCEPCPMCLGAIYWSRARQLYFASTRGDAAEAGFSDQDIYSELSLAPPERSIQGIGMLREEGRTAFRKWAESPLKILY